MSPVANPPYPQIFEDKTTVTRELIRPGPLVLSDNVDKQGTAVSAWTYCAEAHMLF